MLFFLLTLFNVVSAYEFVGDLTFYGGAGVGGSCTSSYVPEGYTTVAMNSDQYDNGLVCGSCLEGVYHVGGESIYFSAIADNLCPECVYGDLDLGEIGDGRWDLEWSFVACPKTELVVTTQGSNSFYAKIKIEGGGAVDSVTVNGAQASPTPDGYWVVEDGSGSLGCGPTIDVVLDDGTKKTMCADGALFGGDCSGIPCEAGDVEETMGDPLEEPEVDEEPVVDIQPKEEVEPKEEVNKEEEVNHEEEVNEEEEDKEEEGTKEEVNKKKKPTEEEEVNEKEGSKEEVNEEEEPKEDEEVNEEEEINEKEEPKEEVEPKEEEKVEPKVEPKVEEEVKPKEEPKVNEERCAPMYRQCGGSDHEGPVCCEDPYTCVVVNEWYSQCRYIEHDGEKCQSQWKQCGGFGWSGETCCKRGFKCTYKNDWYSHCI